MTKNVAVLVAVMAFLATVTAECPNACSAHGKCGAYDMCTCFRNWMSNDCSERICQFGLAHVDTPKGDLDASSGKLTGPDVVVAVNSAMYPYGTTEQYPAVTDIDGNVLKNTAHEYRECSNKGICDRSSGTCACFEGYEGSSCQRASCPVGPNGVCSGHGTCQTISEIAGNDYGNVYKLWDEDATMGCVCDGGYDGPDCSQRRCKYGVDPLYKDNDAVIRYSNFTYNLYLESSSNNIYGNYSLVFFDSYGEDWQTKPIAWNADCSTVIDALEGLPNSVIGRDTVRCQQRGAWNDAAVSLYVKNGYTLAFPENPGKLKQIQLNKYLDGTRPTLFSDEATSTLGWHVYADGFVGEDHDLVPDRCEGVEVTLLYDGSVKTGIKLDGLDATETKLLKKCLGDSNGMDSDNTEVYNWDKGNTKSSGYFLNPHLIKLQDATQFKRIKRSDLQGGADDYDPILQQIPVSLLCDNAPYGDPKRFGMSGSSGFCANKDAPGFYAVLYFDAGDSSFRILANPALTTIYSTTTPFYVYTTTGHLQLVSKDAHAYTARTDYSSSLKVDRYFSNVLKTTNVTSTNAGYFGDLSCENNGKGKNGALDCLNKNDLIMVLRSEDVGVTQQKNVYFHNIYQIQKIGQTNKPEHPEFGTNPAERQEIVLDYSMNTRYVFDSSAPANYGAQIYKFYPPKNGGYHYAGPCANRGICNQESGLCECFHGYSDDDCHCINALAV